MSSEPRTITQILLDWNQGRRGALEELMPVIYGELHRLARRQLRRESPGHTLQTTALVHEAYLRLVGQRHVHWRNRLHFYALAAQMMRRILANHARDRARLKRGRAYERVSLEEALAEPVARDADLVALDDALNALSDFDPQLSRVVELRYFAGMTIGEMAEVLEVCEATVKNKWTLARTFLYRELRRRGKKL